MAITSNCPKNTHWVPWADASDFPATSVCLLLKSLCAESVDNTFPTETFANTDCVNKIAFCEDRCDWDLLFEEGDCIVNLSSNIATIDLNFDDVCLLLADVELVHLCVCNNTNDSSFLLDLFDLLWVFLCLLFEGAECLACL